MKSKTKKQIFTIFVLIMFLGSSIAFAVISIVPVQNPSPKLPPIDIQGHVEASPPSHILKEPMPIEIQKHMLEHADGYGPPGVIINYNCEDYFCEEDLIEKLEEFALKYNHVYVAPFPGMEAKIALTRYGKIEILDDYDEEKIENFILSE